jgi:putative chitinase
MAFIDTLVKLKNHVPGWVYDQLPQMLKYGVNGPKRMSHTLGQCRHETGNWTRLSENLNYTDPVRIANIFKSDFDLDKDKVIEPHEIEFAKKFVRRPEAMANYVYQFQNGNGSEASGEGWKHRGFGPLQITGKKNQVLAFRKMGLPDDTDPERLAKDLAMASAAVFFDNNSLWDECDRGVTALDVKAVTRVVNPALLGLSERVKYTQGFYKILTS